MSVMYMCNTLKMINIEIDWVIIESELREMKIKHIYDLSDNGIGGLVDIKYERRVSTVYLD